MWGFLVEEKDGKYVAHVLITLHSHLPADINNHSSGFPPMSIPVSWLSPDSASESFLTLHPRQLHSLTGANLLSSRESSQGRGGLGSWPGRLLLPQPLPPTAVSTVTDKDTSSTWSVSEATIIERKLYTHWLQSVKLDGFGVETLGQAKCQSGTVGPKRPLGGGDIG